MMLELSVPDPGTPELVAGWQWLSLPTVTDERGSVTVMEAQAHIPFPIERIYLLHGVPVGQRRAGHAHRALKQVLIAAAGGFDITCDDGRSRRRYRLDRPDGGLLIPSMVWIDLELFDPGAVCLVMASARHDPADYIRDYEAFVVEATSRL